MIIVDTALARREEQNRPVRVAVFGTGYMGRGIMRQLLKPLPGMRLAGVFNRTLDNARSAFREIGVDEPAQPNTVVEVDATIEQGRPLAIDDWSLLCTAANVDVVLEATGDVEFGAEVALKAIEHGKHVVLMNAELDATVGPMLKVHADKAGVVITNCDGDEPGVANNLVRFARTVGYTPVASGNIKGMIDKYRNPDTQRAFAEQYRQNVHLVTSAADGTKLSMEATVLANATGFGVGQPGMHGPELNHVKDLLEYFSDETFRSGGIVDYTVGAAPHTGAWVIGYNESPADRQYMSYFKMGEGPYYCFYTPYHLPHLQVLTTVARAALFTDATTAPIGAPCTEVATVAKRDLKAGTLLDGIGGFDAYGEIYNIDEALGNSVLPMGLSSGARLLKDIPRDQVISYDDVQRRKPVLVDKLREEQDQYFFPVSHKPQSQQGN